MLHKFFHSEHEKHFRDLFIGIGIILIARLAMALVVLLSRFAYKEVPISMVLFFQNLFAFLFVIPFLFKYRLSALKTNNRWLIFMRILFGFIALVVLIISAQMITMTGAILLNNSGPLFVPFVALIWRKVPINNKLWPGVILGFLGLGLVLNPGSSVFGQSVLRMEIGWGLGIIGGVCIAIAMIAMRILRSEKMFPILFYYYLFASIVTFPFALASWKGFGVLTLIILFVMGALTIIMQGGYLMAFRYGKAAHLSPFFYIAVLYGAILDWLVYNHVPGLFQTIGMVLLIIGGVLVIVFSKPPKDTPSPRS